jgi:hypothetical protein
MWDSLFSRMRSVYHLGRDALKNVKKLGHRVVNIAKSRHGQGLLSAVDQFIPGAKQKVNSAIEWGSNNILNNLNKVDKFANRAESLYDNVVMIMWLTQRWQNLKNQEEEREEKK